VTERVRGYLVFRIGFEPVTSIIESADSVAGSEFTGTGNKQILRINKFSDFANPLL
jgi:hypothetical protein